MPFKSKAQHRWMRAAEAKGEIPEGTASRWAHATKGGVKRLPERVSSAITKLHKAKKRKGGKA